MSDFVVGYFVGSLAKASINRKLAKALVRLAPAGLAMRELPFGELPPSSYDYDADYPEAARELKAAIADVDAVLFVEENQSPVLWIDPMQKQNAANWCTSVIVINAIREAKGG